MKIQIFLCLLAYGSLSAQYVAAADFSHAQQTIVPPSYIRRDLDALGTNNWSFPGLNSSSTDTNSNSTGINSNPDPGVGTMINRSASSQNPGYVAGTQKSLAAIQKQISSLVNAGQLPEAEDLARSGLKPFPNSSILKNQFANITASEAQSFLQAQNYDLAGKKARESLVANPNNKTAKSVIASVLRSQGLDPNLAEGHVAAGDALSGEGRLLEASVEYKLALVIKPNAAAHVGLGNIAIGKGQIVDAGRHFERALSLDPNSFLAYRQRGALRYFSKDVIGASADFSKAVSLNPNDQLAAEALVGLWKQQVAAYPNSTNSHLGLARAYMQTQNLEAARNEYKTVVAIDPNNPVLPAARASFKLALAKQEANQYVQAAKTLDGQGAWNDAHQKLSEAMAYCPNDPQILLYNGQICERLGLAAEAHDSYMAVLKADPKNLQAAERLKALGCNNQIPATAYPGILPMPQSQSSINAPQFAAPINMSPPANTFPSANNSPPTNRLVRPGQFSPTNSFAPSNSYPISNPPSNLSAPTQAPVQAPAQAPSLNANPAPLPDENLQNAPLKSPLTPKAQSNLQIPFGNAYYVPEQNLYIGQPAQVTALGNFGSCVRALIMAEKQFLGSPPRGEYVSGTPNSTGLSSNPESYF